MFFSHYLDPRFPSWVVNQPSPEVWWELVMVGVVVVLLGGASLALRAKPGRAFVSALVLTLPAAAVVGGFLGWATRYHQAPHFSFEDTEAHPFVAILVSPTDEPLVDPRLSFKDHCVVVISQEQWDRVERGMAHFVPSVPLPVVDSSGDYDAESRASTTVDAYSTGRQALPRVMEGLGSHLVEHCGSPRAKELWAPPVVTIDKGSSFWVLLPKAGNEAEPPTRTTLDGSRCGWVASFDTWNVQYEFSEYPDRVAGIQFGLKDVPESLHGAVLVAAVDPDHLFVDADAYVADLDRARSDLSSCVEGLGL